MPVPVESWAAAEGTKVPLCQCPAGQQTQGRRATLRRLEAVKPPLDATERAYGSAAEEPFKPTAGRAASMLVKVPALLAFRRSYLAHFHGDAETTVTFASRALAELGAANRTDAVARAPGSPSPRLGARVPSAEGGNAGDGRPMIRMCTRRAASMLLPTGRPARCEGCLIT